jgi:hypothetical protein
MSRKIKDFIEIKDHASLDELIEKLIEVRDSLPPESGAEVKMKGDDIFGRHLSVCYFRPQTTEEVECDARYAEAYRESRERQLNEASDCRQGRLRAVA